MPESIGAVLLLLHLAAPAAPPSKACVWSDHPGIAACFAGDIDKVPCDYAHPSEFSDEDWARFADRCR